MRNILFTPKGWADYTYWYKEKPQILKRTNMLIHEVARDPLQGIGKPEPLKGCLQGCWSRRIDLEHRLVYREVKRDVHILGCRYHY